MNIINVPALLDRIETGSTTVYDADALCTFIKRTPDLYQSLNADPDDLEDIGIEGYHFEEGWTARAESDAVVVISYDPTRYARGEIVFQAFYTLPDGTVETDRSRRVNIPDQIGSFLRDLWDVLFDTACMARYCDPLSLLIHINLPEDPEELPPYPKALPDYIRAIAEVTAAELNAYVSGAAPNPYDFT